MALALLDLVGLENSNVRFRIDTGTNRYYQLKLGRSMGSRSGLDWIDEVVYQTPVTANKAGGGLLDTSTEIAVPADRLERGRAYAQLFSFKTSKGGSPAFSPVVAVDRAMSIPAPDYVEPESTEMQEVMDSTRQSFERPRAVACRTCAEQFSAPALGDLLTQVVRVAAPVVMNLIGQPQGAPAAGTAPAGTAAATAPDPLAGLVEAILKLIGTAAPATGAQAPALATPSSIDNRFGNGGSHFARPFVFGIDDAILGALVGQVVQILPQLQNAANQKRIQLQQGQNKLVSDAIAGVNQRLLLDQVLQAQRQAPAAQAADLAKLAELLQQAGANGQQPAAPAAAPQSLSLETRPDPTLSSRAVAAFAAAPPVRWNGTDHVVFPTGRPLELKVRLAVADPAPKAPLPKAIVRVVVKDASDQTVFAEKVVKQKDVLANGIVTIPFSAAELAPVPAGKPVTLLAEFRWLNARGSERKALGSAEAVFVNRYFVKEPGVAGGPERELTDMTRYRAFWNKVWESPALDAAAPGARRLLWELDANLKFSVLIAPDQPSNGLMETKVLVAAKDAEAVTDRTEGRMKGGIELSIDELSKLAPLWGDEPVLDADRLAAFRTPDFAKANGSELVHRLKLKGRAAERGLVWVVPVFQLVEFTLGSVQTTDESGQVIAVTEEKVRLPLPVAARVIGLRSGSEDSAEETPSGDDAHYVFDGFKVELSEKVALMPAGAAAPRAEGQWLRG